MSVMFSLVVYIPSRLLNSLSANSEGPISSLPFKELSWFEHVRDQVRGSALHFLDKSGQRKRAGEAH